MHIAGHTTDSVAATCAPLLAGVKVRCMIAQIYAASDEVQREQLRLFVEDASLNPWAVAAALRNSKFKVNGLGVIHHRDGLCDCS